MRYHIIIAALTGLLLGCQDDSESVAVQPQVEQVQGKPCHFRDARLKRFDVTGERCQWISEHNYIVYSEDLSPPDKPGIIPSKPSYAVYKAKEWSREDLNDASSYDKPRIQFWWDNDHKGDKYEKADKIWSIKVDGTDLRLVTDAIPVDGVRQGELRRSPNMRYVAYAYSNADGLFKAIFDLQTQETTIIGKSRSKPFFVWEEDSQAVHYSNGGHYYRYDLVTQTKTTSPLKLSNSAVIRNGQLVYVGDIGLGIYDIKTGARLKGIKPSDKYRDSYSLGKRAYTSRIISPNGKYAWMKNSLHKLVIDTDSLTIIRELPTSEEFKNIYHKPNNLSNDSFMTQQGVATMRFYNYQNLDKYIHNGDYRQSWVVIQTGRRTTNPNLYNADANDGKLLEGNQ
ncbi:hypothetical protein N9R79_02770 [Vibrio sp.]|nr:hypothetical protein [Vibrio sp.]